MHFYDDWARRIVGGETVQAHAFYGLPGYPYLLAFIYKLFGPNPFVPAFLQALLDAGVAAIIYRLTNQSLSDLTSEWLQRSPFTNASKIAALVAALSWGLFVPAQTYSVILMPTVWFVFVFWFIVWRLLRNDDPLSGKECLLLAVFVGLTATAVATVLAIVPLFIAVLYRKQDPIGKHWRAVMAKIGLIVLGLAAGTAPCWVHNYFVARDPVLLSAHSGINFWIGNNPEANGYPRFPPGLRAGQAAMLQDSIDQAEASAGRSLKRDEVSAYWSAKAKNYIAMHFVDWLKLLGRKLRNFWSAFQYDDLSIITTLREQSVTLPGIYFGVVAAFAIPGILFACWFAPRSRWIVLTIASAMAALLPVFITERYRLVAVPGLIIVAAAGLFVFWQACLARDFLVAVFYILWLTISTTLVAWPQKNPSLWALDAYNSGWQALESGDLPLAEKKLALAYAYVPDNSETLFALGNLRLAENDPSAAITFYYNVLRLDPRHKGACNNLGVIALNASQYDDAANWLRRAEDLDPRNAKTHFLLSKVLFARGDRAEARNEIEQATRLNPGQEEFKQLSKEIESSPK